MSLPARLALLALIAVALYGFTLFLGDGRPAPDPAAATRIWTSSKQCAECHRDVWNEWYGSHHQIAYLNPEVRKLSDNFRNKECQACHLPRPVAVTGYAKRTLHRNTRPDEGVGCLTCHLGAGGSVLGTRDLPGAPCQPRASPGVVSVALCESCHNQHWTTDQWRKTEFFARGTDCNDCHMREVERSLAGGRTRRGFDHAFPGSHDVLILRSAVRFGAATDGGKLVVSVGNHGAGHNFPTEERSRAADVLVRFDGGEWKHVHRFRLPYRDEPLPDTTLPHGETKTLRVEVPAGAKRAVARLWYRLTPFVGDDSPMSVLLYEAGVRLATGEVTVTEPALPDGSAFAGKTPVRAGVARAPEVVADDTSRWPALPPLQLTPKLARFERLAAGAPALASDDRSAELSDLLETAFVPGRATARLATMAKRNLLEAEDAFLALEQALAHGEPAVRSNAAFELGNLGRQGSILPLLLRLKYEQEPPVVIWLVDALARLGNHAGLPALSAVMQKPELANDAGLRAVEIATAAGRELSESPSWDELAGTLAALHASWRANGVAAGREPADPSPATRARTAGFLKETEGFALRPVDDARYVLSRMGRLAVPMLVEAVRAQELHVRTHALEILRELGPAGRAAGPDVLPLLADDVTRADAARVLGRIRHAPALPHLLARLTSADIELRAACAGALGWLGDRSAITPLGPLLDDDAQPIDVRVMAAFALAALGEARGRAWLEQCKSDGGYHEPTLVELLEKVSELGG